MTWLGLMGRLLTSPAVSCCSHNSIHSIPSQPYRETVMSQAQLTLISHPLCPFVQRAAIVLLEKNVPFERIDVDLAAKPDWFVTISPTGKVPLLKVEQSDGAVSILFESMAICEYLNETHEGESLYSNDALS